MASRARVDRQQRIRPAGGDACDAHGKHAQAMQLAKRHRRGIADRERVDRSANGRTNALDPGRDDELCHAHATTITSRRRCERDPIARRAQHRARRRRRAMPVQNTHRKHSAHERAGERARRQDGECGRCDDRRDETALRRATRERERCAIDRGRSPQRHRLIARARPGEKRIRLEFARRSWCVGHGPDTRRCRAPARRTVRASVHRVRIRRRQVGAADASPRRAGRHRTRYPPRRTRRDPAHAPERAAREAQCAAVDDVALRELAVGRRRRLQRNAVHLRGACRPRS